ncbi:MAG: FtsW/RodA/SpoVE family cell cycle protein [Ilumatobacteraceae bacterium]
MNAPILPPRSDWRLGNFRAGPGDPSRNIDWSLIAAVVALTVIGAFAIYSATFWKVADDPYWFTVRQVVFAIVSAIVLVVTMSFDYTLLRERAFFLYGCALVALALVLAVGALRGGARLSFDLGPVLFQPAEFAKPAVIVVLAAYLAEIREDSVSYARFIGGLVLVGAPVVFIILQPDLGSAFVIIVGALVIFLMAGAKLRYLVMITFLTVVTVAAAVVAGVVDRYQLRRIEAFLNQNSTDDNLKDLVLQVRFAKRAVGTGGWFGKGYLEAPLTNGKFIPVQQSDFIFSAGRRSRHRPLRAPSLSHLAGGPPQQGHFRHVHLCGRVRDDPLARVPEHRDDHGNHAGDRRALALRELRRVGSGGLFDDDRPGRERAHAANALNGPNPTGRIRGS